MSSFVVYVDHEKAKIFKMGQSETAPISLHSEVKLHHTNNEDNKKKEAYVKLYHSIATQLEPATEILVLGHGTAKDEFMHHLKEHKHEKLVKKVVGVETVDKPTDNQILALARKFFKSAHLYSV